MKWKKKGLIYKPAGSDWWNMHYAMVPTPYYNGEGYLRIYFGTTDKDRNGRIAWIDVDPDDPSRIISASDSYVLDIGEPGSFDDSGVVPSSIIKVDADLYLYYIGFQRCEKVPYLLFPGLAVNSEKKSSVPVLDRDDANPISIGAPFVLQDEDKFKMWYWSGRQWKNVNDKFYIAADICYAESTDGINWDKQEACFSPDGDTEFSLGRPWVVKENGKYHMWYSIRYIDRMYRIGYATSDDGKKWTREDKNAGIDVSESGWDSEMICYASVIKVKQSTFMFYNGNNNGEGGFGYAELINDTL